MMALSKRHKRRTANAHKAWLLCAFLFLAGCATHGVVQPQVNALVASSRPDAAADLMLQNPSGYGANSRLLHHLDKGYVLHLAGRYHESIRSFQQAKAVYDALYTRSLSKEASTWLFNDYWAPYRGEDYEYILINVFQALNYMMIGRVDEALVEARDMDSKLKVIQRLYDGSDAVVYKDDGFARLMAGILYDISGAAHDRNDAYIDYRYAWNVYRDVYRPLYGVDVPQILKENWLATGKWMGQEEYKTAQNAVGSMSYIPVKEQQEKAQVILMHYVGFSPVKVPESIALPVEGTIVKFTIPRYQERYYDTQGSILMARSGGREFKIATEVAEDIGAIAEQNLKAKRAKVLAKAALRPVAKYALQRDLRERARDKYGDNTAVGVNVLSSIFNIYSEQADLRTWVTLPDKIRLGRLWLEPGVYDLFMLIEDSRGQQMEERPLGRVTLRAGETRFLIRRTYF